MAISFPMQYTWSQKDPLQSSVPTAPSLLDQPAQPANNYHRFDLVNKDPARELDAMGVIDRGTANQNYAAGQAERDNRMKQFALGQMLGALGGTVAGRFLGDAAGTGNANGQQAVQNLLPGLAGTQAMIAHTGQEDQRASVDHAAALKNYYDAMFNVRKENDAIDLHNQTTARDVYKDYTLAHEPKEVPILLRSEKNSSGQTVDHYGLPAKDGQPERIMSTHYSDPYHAPAAAMDHQGTQDLKDEADSVKRIRANTDKIRVAKEVIGKAEQAKKSGNYAAIAEALNGTGETDIDKYIESLNGTLRDRKAENDQLIEGIPQERRAKHGLGSSAKSFNIKGGSIGGQKKWFE